MYTPPANPKSKSDDTRDVRHEFCRVVAVGIREGAYGCQARFIRKDEEISDVWFYFYRNHQWHKRDEFAVAAAAAAELFSQLEMVASRDVADAWNCRRVDHHDRTDFELKFQPESLQSHLNNDLESYLMGCLFSGHHDTGKDARRRIRFQGH